MLRLLLVLALLVALPGFFFLMAFFPPHRVRLSALERVYVVGGAGALLVILAGVLMGWVLPGTRFGTLATGFPHVELALAGLCVGLFLIGLARGAYPRLAAVATPLLGWRRAPAGDGPSR